ncbi:MAG: peptidase T [Clostridia bacterium]
MTVTEKFLRYVSVDTMSCPDCEEVPSTIKQRNLSQMLYNELVDLGATNCLIDQHNYVYATIPATTKTKSTLGFIAHVDTSPAVSDTDVCPVITDNYDGGDIKMGKGYVLSSKEYKSLLNHINETVICTNGQTLLGADDKAGVAEIMQLAQILLTDKSILHGEISIAFTPDEEVGRGADFFDVSRFGADFAYTIDGGELGEIEYENFNAASALVEVFGVSIHPGTAKNKMLNAILIAQELFSMLPKEQNPMYTEGYEGFFHLDNIVGNVDYTKCNYIIRDHNIDKFEDKKKLMKQICDFINVKYGKGTVKLTLKDSYFNMYEKILPHIHLIDNAKQAMILANVEPKVMPIRGGTDGARLSFMGLPCPNLCTGGYNFHGRYEYITSQSMEKVVQILLNVVELYSK